MEELKVAGPYITEVLKMRLAISYSDRVLQKTHLCSSSFRGSILRFPLVEAFSSFSFSSLSFSLPIPTILLFAALLPDFHRRAGNLPGGPSGFTPAAGPNHAAPAPLQGRGNNKRA